MTENERLVAAVEKLEAKTQPKERGIQTSECWVLIAYFALIIADGTAYVTIDLADKALLGSLVGGYFFQRFKIKEKQNA